MIHSIGCPNRCKILSLYSLAKISANYTRCIKVDRPSIVTPIRLFILLCYFCYNFCTQNTSEAPVAEFSVKQGNSYRFRIIASTTSTCPFKFAIQNHPMMVVALDGIPCKPFHVDVLVMAAGKRKLFWKECMARFQA